MAKLAIRGHATRGSEVIQLLEMLGGTIKGKIMGNDQFHGYYINSNGNIDYKHYSYFDDAILCTLEEFEKNFPYKVGDIVQSRNTPNHEIYIIKSMEWDSYIKQIYYTIKKTDGIVSQFKWTAQELMPHKTMEENLTIQNIKDNNAAWLLNKLQEMSSEKAMQTINDLYDELHKPQYPKTYKECCEVLGIEEDLQFVYEDIDGNHINPACISNYRMRILDLYHNFEKLKICRDAYWKVAGEQLGWIYPWEPNWKDYSDKYFICYLKDELWMSNVRDCNRFLVFPTEEIRNTFYENFKELIEQCKELL